MSEDEATRLDALRRRRQDAFAAGRAQEPVVAGPEHALLARRVAGDLRALVRSATDLAELVTSWQYLAGMCGLFDELDGALRNLLENALTATDRRGHIDIELERDGGAVVTHVHDDGPGVAPDDRERIFESFVSLGHGGTGAGLGLAIAGHIARAHGGELTCDDCTTGACFTITIPAAAQITDRGRPSARLVPRADGGAVERLKTAGRLAM